MNSKTESNFTDEVIKRQGHIKCTKCGNISCETDPVNAYDGFASLRRSCLDVSGVCLLSHSPTRSGRREVLAMWVNFFTAAGIPSDVSATYALTFTENRIQNDMLLDLNKEYLRDMGISRMGDVIAILRHAKQVHENTARDKVLSTTIVTASNKVPVAAITGRTTVSQPSSPASRILERYTRNPQALETSPPLPAKRKPIETGVATEVGNKKARTIRFTSPPKATVKEGTSNLTVFSRLGNNEPPKVVSTKTVPTKTVPTKTVASKPAAKPIFSRLGVKSGAEPAENPVIPIDKDALKYEGILKSLPQSKKMVTITTTKNVRKISCTMRADEEPLSVKEKLALPKAKSVKFSNHIQYKEIEAINKPQVNNVTTNKKVASFFNKPERRLTLPEPSVNNGVKSRLGTKNVNNLTITSTVFKRLGV